jgi:cytochrome c biogenesis protein CcmG, thiol:disulfide interchange protein DsbE
MQRVPAAIPLVLVCLAVLATTTGCGSEPKAGATATSLAALAAQANQLVGGGKSAFEKQVKALRGHPVVVNQWASWCGPCRFEFPFFQRLAARYRGRVGFLGVDAQDNRGDAEAFLRQRPLPYPSYYDLSASAARTFRGGLAWPTTAFYDARGKLTRTHPGAYASQAKLDEDIRRYAPGS